MILTQSPKLDIPSLKSLRLACFYLNSAVEHLVLASLIIDLRRPRLDSSLSLLRALSSRKTNAHLHVRYLRLKSMSPIAPSDNAIEFLGHAFAFPIPTVSRKVNLKHHYAMRVLESYLFSALSKLPRLRTVW